jgi:glucose-6-phosphate dehydrogenase assembly protein OpcA
VSGTAAFAVAPREVPVGAIEREIAALWRATATGAPEHPVIRACMSNLVVYCKTDQDAGVVMGELPEVLARHPARAVLLVADDAADGDSIDACVAAHCHLREGSQVCGESVTLTGRGTAARRTPSIARALLVGDLPTTLWWATPEPPALGGALYAELAAMAEQVVFDSLGWPEPVRGMAAMGRLGQERPLLTDVCWRRLRGWRRILSQSLDPAFAPGAIEHAGQLVLEHGPHALTQCWLLAGWLACRLGWRPDSGPKTTKGASGTELTWRFQGGGGPVSVTARRQAEGAPEIVSIALAPTPGCPAPALTFKNGGGGRLSVESDGAQPGVRTLALPIGSRASMIARQLSDLAPDPLFRETLAVAATMAASLPH